MQDALPNSLSEAVVMETDDAQPSSSSGEIMVGRGKVTQVSIRGGHTYSLFALRKTRSLLRINGERAF